MQKIVNATSREKPGADMDSVQRKLEEVMTGPGALCEQAGLRTLPVGFPGKLSKE